MGILHARGDKNKNEVDFSVKRSRRKRSSESIRMVALVRGQRQGAIPNEVGSTRRRRRRREDV